MSLINVPMTPEEFEAWRAAVHQVKALEDKLRDSELAYDHLALKIATKSWYEFIKLEVK